MKPMQFPQEPRLVNPGVNDCYFILYIYIYVYTYDSNESNAIFFFKVQNFYGTENRGYTKMQNEFSCMNTLLSKI